MDKYDNYITVALGNEGQSRQKINQFKKNYSFFFPLEKTVGILDIGPGKGEMLTCLSELDFKNVQAVDISESVVEYCKNIGHEVFHSRDLVAFLKGDKRYSLITMCDVVEHIPKDQILYIMTAVYDALDINGMLIVQVPNMQSITSNIFMYDDFTHEAGYTERSLKQMLTLCGFKLIECYGFEFLDDGAFSKIHSVLRKMLWVFVKIIRRINGTMPHSILHPVFFAVARK